MSKRCSPKEFKRRRTKEAINLLYNKNAITYKLHPSGKAIEIIPSNKSQKIKTKEQARMAAEGMLRKLQKKFGEEYMFNVFGNWGTIYNTPEGAMVEINIPQRLVDAIEYKESGGQLALFDMPASEEVEEDPVNFMAYVKFKKALLKRTEKALQNAFAKNKYDKSDRDIIRRIEELKQTKENLLSDIEKLTDEEIIWENVLASLGEDVGTIDRLIQSGTIENLHTAEKMLNFIESIGNYSRDNTENPIFDTSEDLPSDVTDVLDELTLQLRKRVNALSDAKRDYLRNLVSKSTHIQNMFPHMEMEDILEETEDIDILSMLFLTPDKQFTSTDSLLAQLIKIELETSRSLSKGFVAGIKARLDKAVTAAKDKLPKISNIFGYVETDYSMFYQKNSKGNRSPKLVTRYSAKWFNFEEINIKQVIKDIHKIRRTGKGDIEATKNELYNNINQNANFLNLQLLPEVLQHPVYSRYIENADMDAANQYKIDLISKIGLRHYEQLIDNQLADLENFENWKETKKEDTLEYFGVKTLPELPRNALRSLAQIVLRTNPYELSKSHHSGRRNKVSLVPGGEDLLSNVANLQYYPKEQIAYVNPTDPRNPILADSKYYDLNFKNIEADDDLYRLWEIFEEGADFINSTIADSEKQLVHGSILSMKKSWLDLIIDPNLGIANKFILISKNALKYILKHFTGKTMKRSPENEEDISKAQFKTVEKEARQIQMGLEMEIERKIDRKILKSRLVKNSKPTEQLEVLKILNKEFGTPLDITGFYDYIGKPIVVFSNVIEELSLNKVTEQQTFNLPVIFRAYLEMAAEYKAQSDSQPMISIYKDAYEKIKRTESTGVVDKIKAQVYRLMSKSQKNMSTARSATRMKYWYDRNILGSANQDVSAPIPDMALDFVKPGLRIEWKVWEDYEKKLRDEIREKLKDPNLTDREAQTLQAELDQLGYNVTGSAIYNAIFNQLGIFVGLGFSFKANVVNRFQGVFQTIFHDTGRFATEGNFTKAMRFITHKGLRYLPGFGEYKKQITMARLLVNKLNVLQDATNEIDRARNESGLTGVAKKITPFYITEYTEWHNQTPQILGVLMDKIIYDKNGSPVQVFDGKSFPAFTINERGLLDLEEDFDTPENRATWIDFSNETSATNKLYLNEVISTINGDYSKTGGIYFKKNIFGRTLALFKTWLPNNIWVRFAKEHDNLILGKKQKGIYASHRPITIGITLAAIGMVSAGIPLALTGGALGLTAGYFVSKRNGRELTSMAHSLKEMSFIVLELLNKMRGIPQGIITGKVVKSQLDNLDIETDDLQRLKSICNEISMILTVMLIKVMMNALAGPNDEDEPKTVDGLKLKKDGSNANPYYPGNVQSERHKKLYRALENQISRLLEDTTLYLDPFTFVNNVILQNRLTMVMQQLSLMPNVINKFNNGLDEITQGPDKGKSRLLKNVSQFTLPAIVRNPTSLGFESLTTRDFESDFFDTYFDSDYMKDKKRIKAARTLDRQAITEVFKEELKYDELSKEDKVIADDIIKTQVNDVINAIKQYPNRLYYGEDQSRTKEGQEYINSLELGKVFDLEVVKKEE